MVKALIKKLANKAFNSFFYRIFSSIVLYRDLLIICALPKYPVYNRFFFGKQITVLISEPTHFCSELPPQLEEKLGIYTPIRKYCNTFENVSILGGTSPIVLSLERKPLWNTIAYQFFNWEKYYTPIKWFLQSRLKFQWFDEEYAVFIYSTWSSNYFHWLLDNLARLQFLDFMDDSIKAKTKILIGGKLSPFQTSSLLALGFENIEYIEKNNFIVKRLFVPNFSLEQQGYDLDQIIWLRNKIFQNLKNVKFESDITRVLILRRPVNGRSFLNQEEVLNALIPLGFKAFYLEELSFEEQVNLFKRANCIVAAHGAGLANIIFSEKATVIEIFGKTIFPCYFQLAKTLGLSYSFLLCKSGQSAGGAKNEDLKVDVSLLLRLTFH
ncbi:glycosyltransferase family 61 protein [Nostoc sp.]|uniref:glycosyltransferase family 61 protein n=1 Tax=Nostoc sp. TaxID=1180 RepID=UPI002FF93A01